MSAIDWIVLIATLITIISYGIVQSRTSKNLDGYFLSNRSMPWYLVLLSIMGTQASAITFLSAPGQAFTDGMRFVQYYFGLPIAMVIIASTFVPIFSKLKVYTAYEYIESRFDLKTRTLTAFLFLLSRGLSTGISVYAPSIILSTLLGWNIFWTNIFMGGLLIIYTVSGGAKAVAYTQRLQLIIIFGGLFAVGYYIVAALPAGVGFTEALNISGAAGKMNIITSGMNENGFEWKDRYNIISGIIGGGFLALSYFGTDQSQVGRYLTAKDNTESKIGLLMNGLVKVPMQFLILLLGALLFTFYQFKPQPIFFNQHLVEKAHETAFHPQLKQLEAVHHTLLQQQQVHVAILAKNENNLQAKDSFQYYSNAIQYNQKQYRTILAKAVPNADHNDTNYIFLRFVVDYLPHGLIGLLIAIIFLASWGSIAAALNSLASSTMVDFHLRFKKTISSTDVATREVTEYRMSKWYTLAWGIFCIITAECVTGMGSLIEAVNVLGSLFYGVILGVFLVAFFLKYVKSDAVFWAAIIGEILVIICFYLDRQNIIGIGFLWLNVIGALLVVLLALLLQAFKNMVRK